MRQQRMHPSDSELHYWQQVAADVLKALSRVCGLAVDAFSQGLDNV